MITKGGCRFVPAWLTRATSIHGSWPSFLLPKSFIVLPLIIVHGCGFIPAMVMPLNMLQDKGFFHAATVLCYMT